MSVRLQRPTLYKKINGSCIKIDFYMFPLFIMFTLTHIQIKCLKYWPSASPEMYGPVFVSPGDEEELADYVVRKFTIQMVSLPSIVIFSLL